MLPKDPAILLSYVNTHLRDHYKDLNDFCKSENIEKTSLQSTLSQLDYVYDADQNQFI